MKNNSQKKSSSIPQINNNYVSTSSRNRANSVNNKLRVSRQRLRGSNQNNSAHVNDNRKITHSYSALNLPMKLNNMSIDDSNDFVREISKKINQKNDNKIINYLYNV